MGSFDALRHRNYRLLWIGAFLSNVGTWMQTIAVSWYVFLLTHSALWVSFIAFVTFIPTVLAPVGGVYTDRMDRKHILVWTQAVMLVQAAALAVLAWTGHAGLFLVMALTFGLGLMYAFNGPTWLAFITTLVPPEAMVNAIALNSAQFNLARVVGPAIAGVIVGTVDRGAAIVFAINAVSFVAVLASLTMIHEERRVRPERRTVWELFRGGLDYALRHRRIRSQIVAIGVMSFFAAPAAALLPIFAADVYGRGAGSYGLLAAATGVGSVLGALVLGRLGNRITPVHVAGALASLGILLVLFGSVTAFAAGLVILFLYGTAFLMFVSGSNSEIQLQVDEGFRGRVVSIWMLSFGVLWPTGSLVAGAVASAVGPRATTIAGGAACAAWGLGMLRWFPGRAPRPALEPGS